MIDRRARAHRTRAPARRQDRRDRIRTPECSEARDVKRQLRERASLTGPTREPLREVTEQHARPAYPGNQRTPDQKPEPEQKQRCRKQHETLHIAVPRSAIVTNYESAPLLVLNRLRPLPFVLAAAHDARRRHARRGPRAGGSALSGGRAAHRGSGRSRSGRPALVRGLRRRLEDRVRRVRRTVVRSRIAADSCRHVRRRDLQGRHAPRRPPVVDRLRSRPARLCVPVAEYPHRTGRRPWNSNAVSAQVGATGVTVFESLGFAILDLPEDLHPADAGCARAGPPGPARRGRAAAGSPD